MSGVYVITVIGPEFLNSNDRRHHMVKWRITQQWKTNAGWAARIARTPRFETKVQITAVCLFPDARKRDPANYQDTAKACIDGITDQYVKIRPQYAECIRGILPDDDAAHVIGPDMRARLERGVRVPTIELHISEATE